MNEPLIRDSTPNGNVILAYGEAPHRNKISTILLVIPGLVLCVVLTVALRTLFSATVPVPADAMLLAYVPSSAALPADSPRLWTEAKRTSSFPIFVGYEADERGGRRPFAITVRAFGAKSAQTSWIWQLVQDEESPYDRRTPRSLATGWSDYFSAWLRVWPSRLAPSFDGTWAADKSFAGPVTSAGWTTDLPAPNDIAERDRIFGQNFLNTRSLPGSWDALQQTFRVYDLDLRLTTPPDTVEWSLDDSSRLSVVLAFSKPLDTAAKADLAAAAGLFDRTTYALPDGTVVTEHRPPASVLAGATSTVFSLGDGREISFEEKKAILGVSDLLAKEMSLPENCTGRVLAAFDRLSSRNAFDDLGFSFIPAHERLVVLEKNGKIAVCW